MKHNYRLECYKGEWETFSFAYDIETLKKIAKEHKFKKWRIVDKQNKIIVELHTA